MQKKVKKPAVPIQSSDAKHTPGIRGGHPLSKHHTDKGIGLKQPVKRGKSMSAKKTVNRKRNRQGSMQKTGIVPTFKPFMM